MSVQGLLLDLDGTLAESLDVMYEAYLDFLRQHGHAGTLQEFDELNGPPFGVVLQTLKARYRIAASEEELRRLYGSLVSDRYRQQVRPAEGAAGLLAFCETIGIRVALVTSSSRRVATAFLNTHRLDRHFHAVVGGDDVRAGKPDPEPYTLALQKLGLGPASAIAVEDSATGLRSSTGAGIRTIFLHGTAQQLESGTPLLLACVSRLRDVRGILEREHKNGSL